MTDQRKLLMDLISHTTKDMVLKIHKEMGIDILALSHNDEAFKHIINTILNEDHINSLLTLISYDTRSKLTKMLLEYDEFCDGSNPHFDVYKP